MRILLLTPTYSPKLTGNAVTVQRVATGLAHAGVVCRIMDLSQTEDRDLLEGADTFTPDIVHIFHAYKAGPSGMLLKRVLDVPLITTMTGTDMHLDMKDREKGRTIRRVLSYSDVVTVFNDHAFSLLRSKGIPGEKIRIIHQSVFLQEGDALDYRFLHGVAEQDLVFLMLGGIRRVKRIGYAIDVLADVRKVRPRLRLFLAGPILEPDEYRRIRERMACFAWITYLGEVPRENIVSLLRSVDVVFNTSASESESNALLEAFAFRKTVVARNIPGNSSLLSDRTAFLFRNRRECRDAILAVVDYPAAREQVQRHAENLLKTSFSIEKESTSYLEVYRALVTVPVGRSSGTAILNG